MVAMLRLTVAMVVLTAATAAGAAKGDQSDADPNRQICKTKPVVGSRLKRIRECATAQQWEDLRLQERTGLMRRQVNGASGAGGGFDDRVN